MKRSYASAATSNIAENLREPSYFADVSCTAPLTVAVLLGGSFPVALAATVAGAAVQVGAAPGL